MNNLHTRSDDADLDRRFTAAIAALVDTAPDALSTPDETPDFGRRDRIPHRARLVAVAASIALVAVAGVILVQRDGDRDAIPSAASSPATGPLDRTPAQSGGATETVIPAVDPFPTATGFLLPAYVPPGYQIVHVGATEPWTEAPTTSPTSDPFVVDSYTRLERLDEHEGGFIDVASGPNTTGETIDSLLAGDGDNGPVFQRELIGGVARAVRRDQPDEHGPFTVVKWVDDGLVLSVTGRADPAEVIAVAEGASSATFDQFVAAGRAITKTAAALPILDRAVFDDAIEVTVRTFGDPAAVGAIALCIEQPKQECVFQFADEDWGTNYFASQIDSFTIDGDNVLIQWQDTAEAQELGVPTLSGNQMVDDAAPAGPVPEPAPTTAQVDQQVTTEVGRFTRIGVPAGEKAPTLNYSVGDGIRAAVPGIRAPYVY